MKTTKAHAVAYGIAVGIVLLFACFSAGAATGVDGESRRPGLLFVGMQLGYSPGDVGAFWRCGHCTPRALLVEWFFGARLHRYFAVQTNIMSHSDLGCLCAQEIPEPPIPPSGPYTRRGMEFGDALPRYPYDTSEIDVIAEPLPAASAASLRLIAGYGWIWTKDIPMWLAGAGFAAGNERVRFVLDIKKYWFEVPYESVTYHYQDGALVDRHAISRHTNEHPLAILAGVELGIPWFK